MARTIKAKMYTNVVAEYEANAAITPGFLIQLMSTGKVRAHANEGQNAVPMFALENELEGEGVNDAYAAGDRVQCWIPNRGDEVNARISNGENIAVGDFLESNGDGYLQKHVADVDSSNDITTIYPLQIVGQALEACDMSGSSGVDVAGGFCRIRIV